MNKRTNDEAIAREKEHAKTTPDWTVSGTTTWCRLHSPEGRIWGFSAKDRHIVESIASRMNAYPALLALVERVAKCEELRTGDLYKDANAILAQLKP